MNALIEI